MLAALFDLADGVTQRAREATVIGALCDLTDKFVFGRLLIKRAVECQNVLPLVVSPGHLGFSEARFARDLFILLEQTHLLS